MGERRSFWRRLFGGRGSSLSQRQERVLRYVIARTNEGVPLREVLGEEYVRRNTSQAEIDEIVRSPELIEAAREQLGESFRSDEFKP
jgi:hypothetical protein